MKKIFLVGDSIRIGYDKYVRESMTNVAQVYFTGENCRFAEYILRYLHIWVDDLNIDDVDAVHWNTGLWDTLKLYGDSECLAPLDSYVHSLERIADRIKTLFPNAVSIFATTTPVIESGFIPEFEIRYNSDIERYNAAAVEALEKKGVIINDLHSLVKDLPDSYHSDQTHYYTADATELIGGRVNEVLCDALGIDKSLLIKPDKMKYHREYNMTDVDLYRKVGRIYKVIRDKYPKG